MLYQRVHKDAKILMLYYLPHYQQFQLIFDNLFLVLNLSQLDNLHDYVNHHQLHHV